jgi:predicted DNA-binding protein
MERQMSRKEKIDIRLSDEEAQEVLDYCTKTGLTKTKLVRKALRQELDQFEFFMNALDEMEVS